MNKLILLLSVLLFASCTTEFYEPSTNIPDEEEDDQTEDTPLLAECINGFADIYPCEDYDLASKVTMSELFAEDGNDCWGWTDATTGKEYALMGVDNGTAFIDISTPTEPIYLGKLPTHTDSSPWRDIKVYNNYAFVVSEANNHGMQVFDLTRLRDVSTPPETFTEDAHYNGFGGAHNIIINEDTGFAYVVGADTFNGGPNFINIQNPLNPIDLGGFAMDGYTHDAQVVTYNGPDSDYTGKEIFIGSNTDEVVILDVTDKGNPRHISSISYENVAYTHQGWFTEDQQYFILGDEIDEINLGFNTKTIIFDFSDLDNPILKMNYFGTTLAIDHNGYVKGNLLYLANYTAGVRIIDISDIENNNVVEVGSFDTFPTHDAAAFLGAWNVYPFFPSGNIIISDINTGLYVIKKKN